jgi:hypothetical protein
MHKGGKRVVRDKGAYLVDEKNIGPLLPETTAIVLDQVWDRDKFKDRIKVNRTSKPELHCGHHTIAVFYIAWKLTTKPKEQIVEPPKSTIDESNVHQ